MDIIVVVVCIVQMEQGGVTAKRIHTAIRVSIVMVKKNVSQSLEPKQNALQIVNVRTTNAAASMERKSVQMEVMVIHVIMRATVKALIVVAKDLMGTRDVFQSLV